MSNDDELHLVRKAIGLAGTTGCFEWDEDAAIRVLRDASLKGLTPDYIRTEIYKFVIDKNGAIQQRNEAREFNYEFWYKVILPLSGFVHGVFVELVLSNNDPDFPCVTIVSSHEQKR